MKNYNTKHDKTTCLISFVDFLHEEGLPYVILGNTTNLPAKIDSDIDFSIKIYLDRLTKLIYKFCHQYNLNLVQVLQHEHTAFYFILAWNDSNNDLVMLCPDICTDYFRQGRKLLTAKQLLKDSRLNKSITCYFYISEPPVAFIYYFIKRLEKGEIEVKHMEYLMTQWQQNPGRCQYYIRQYFGSTDSSIISDAFINNDFSIFKKQEIQLRNNLRKCKQIQPTIQERIKELLRKIKRVREPTGLHIVILGMDGSGKSSVLEKIIPQVAPAFRGTKIVHLRPHLGKKTSSNDILVTDPHAEPARSLFMSLIKLAYFWVDYTIGYLLTIKPKLIRSTLVVYDRYFHDLLVDPKRYRYSAPLCIAKTIIKLIPQPDLIILLNVTAETAQSRKQEVSFEESVRQAKAYVNLVGSLKNGIIIDANQVLEKVCEDVQDVVIEYLVTRTKERYGE